MIRLLFLVGLLAAAPLCAHESEVYCNFRLSGLSDHSGTKVSVEADPLWGHANAEALAATEATQGKFAKVVVSGEGETDKSGALRLKVTFSFEGEGVRPTRSVRRDKEQIEVATCYARLIARREGFRAYVGVFLVTDGEEAQSTFTQLQPVITVRGSVIHLSNRAPVADLELRLSTTIQIVRPGPGGRDGGRGGDRGRPQVEPVPELKAWTLKTDAKGEFKLTDETLPPGSFQLTPLGGKLAFTTTSKAARDMSLREGDNDLGTLIVAPGGTLKLRVLNSQDDTPVNARCNVTAGNYWRNLVLSEGSGELLGMVEGEFSLDVRHNNFWELRQQVTVKAGEVTDLGDLRLDPILSVDVIALSDTSGGIENYSVTARMLEGERPPNYEHEFQRGFNLTAENTTLTGLRRGKWLITVQAKGHARAEVEVTLPATEPLTVTLSQGGTLQVTVKLNNEQEVHSFTFFAVRCDSAYYETLQALKPGEWQRLRIDTTQRGVYAPERSWNGNPKIEAMAPGTYLVIVAAGSLGWMKRDNVEVVAGKTTSLELTPEPPTMTVKVTRDGKPAPGEKLYFVMSDWSRGSEFVEATTGPDGVCTHAFKGQGQGYVLTQNELQFLGKPGQQHHEWHSLLRKFKGDGQELRYGGRAELAIELHDRNAIWVTLLVKLPEGVSIAAPTLVPKLASPESRRYFTPKQIEGGWLYPNVPAGEYVATASIATATGERITLTRDIKVDTVPAQSIAIEFDLKTFSVTLELPQGLSSQNISVQMLPAGQADAPDPTAMSRHGRPDAAGKVAFLGLDAGEYVVVATAWNRQNALLAGARQFVDTGKTSQLTLKLTDDLGTLHLQVEGNPATGGRSQDAAWRVQFFDDMENEVKPIHPSFAMGAVNSGAQDDDWRRRDEGQGVRGVPTGRYRIVVTAHGLQPCEQRDVEIKRGQTTRLTVTPSAAAMLKVTLKGITVEGLNAGAAQATYYDAAGNEVDVAAPDRRLFWVAPSDRGDTSEARLLNLMPSVTRVVIRIKGYEAIEVPIQFEPGRTFLHTAEVKRRAD